MKIRINGNSVRIRLSRSEVEKLAGEGYLEESTSFGDNTLVYALQTKAEGDELTADFVGAKVTMYVPRVLTKEWPSSTVVGFSALMPLGDAGSLHLLLEKDFACIEAVAEDQSDNYENPNKTC